MQRRDVIQICLTKVGMCPNHFELWNRRSLPWFFHSRLKLLERQSCKWGVFWSAGQGSSPSLNAEETALALLLTSRRVRISLR